MRANEEAKALHGEIGAFVGSKPYTAIYELQSEDGKDSEYCARIKFRPIHPFWNVRIGEILHNFRASLDNAIWELVKRNGNTPKRFLHAFPITDSDRAFHGGPGIGRPGISRLQGVDDAVMTIVEAFQPYKARDYGLDPHRHPFWVLRELSDIDKHRTLHVTVLAARVQEKMTIVTPDGVQLTDCDPIVERHWLVDGARMFGFTANRPVADREVQVQTEFAFRVVFDQQTVAEVPAVGGLNIMTVLRFIDDEVKAIGMGLRAVAEIAEGH